MKKYGYWILILLGQGLMWYNVDMTYHDNSAFALWWLGMLLTLIGILWQISSSNYKNVNIK